MIEPHADVRGYFRERLLRSLERHRVRTDSGTEFYLVNLLAEFAIAPPLPALDRPLAEQLAEALETEGHERLRRFRGLGDAALYVSGFFADHLERRGITPDYAGAMGGRAYRSASALVRLAPPRDAVLAPVYDELADKFGAYVDVLGDVREAATPRTPQDIVRLYEKWKRSRSPALAEELRSVGLFPVIEAETSGRGTLH
jgi:hypothetical protein